MWYRLKAMFILLPLGLLWILALWASTGIAWWAFGSVQEATTSLDGGAWSLTYRLKVHFVAPPSRYLVLEDRSGASASVTWRADDVFNDFSAGLYRVGENRYVLDYFGGRIFIAPEAHVFTQVGCERDYIDAELIGRFAPDKPGGLLDGITLQFQPSNQANRVTLTKSPSLCP